METWKPSINHPRSPPPDVLPGGTAHRPWLRRSSARSPEHRKRRQRWGPGHPAGAWKRSPKGTPQGTGRRGERWTREDFQGFFWLFWRFLVGFHPEKYDDFHKKLKTMAQIGESILLRWELGESQGQTLCYPSFEDVGLSQNLEPRWPKLRTSLQSNMFPHFPWRPQSSISRPWHPHFHQGIPWISPALQIKLLSPSRDSTKTSWDDPSHWVGITSSEKIEDVWGSIGLQGSNIMKRSFSFGISFELGDRHVCKNLMGWIVGTEWRKTP